MDGGCEIQEWLDSWDTKYIRDNLVEYTHMNGISPSIIWAKGVRIGRPWVQRLEYTAQRRKPSGVAGE